MSGGLHWIAEEAGWLAGRLPVSLVEDVAARLAAGDRLDQAALRNQIAQSLPSPHHRALVVDFAQVQGLTCETPAKSDCPQNAQH